MRLNLKVLILVNIFLFFDWLAIEQGIVRQLQDSAVS